MRTAFIVFAAYASLLTAVLFGSERTLTEPLARELSRRMSAELEARPVAHRHTLFSEIVVGEIDARIRSERTVYRPHRVLSTATISACNPRASTCF